VTGAHRFALLSLASGGHACGLTIDGRAWCWGLNHHGQLGVDSVFEYAEQPLAVAGGHRFRQLSAGGLHTCALTGDGTAWCWGIDVLPPRSLGDTTYHHPNRVASSLRFTAIESGRYSECGLVEGGAAYCWGSNGAGELGTTPVGSTVRFDTPVAVGGRQHYSAILGESQSYCGLSLAGGTYCWGAGTSGELGTGTANSTVPLRVPGT
jgi:alpha-tubulin suppressor-like RCC1 family protein